MQVTALPARRPRPAATCAAVALVCLVVGYYATNELRGVPSGTRAVLFWTSPQSWPVRCWALRRTGCGGAPRSRLEWASGCRRDPRRRGRLRPAFYRRHDGPALLALRDRLRFALLCLVGVTRLRRPAPLAAAGCTAVAVAAVFVALYSLDLLSLL